MPARTTEHRRGGLGRRYPERPFTGAGRPASRAPPGRPDQRRKGRTTAPAGSGPVGGEPPSAARAGPANRARSAARPSRAGGRDPPAAGVEWHARPGDQVTAGQPLLTLHTDEPERFDRALASLDGGFDIAPAGTAYDPTPLVHARIR